MWSNNKSLSVCLVHLLGSEVPPHGRCCVRIEHHLEQAVLLWLHRGDLLGIMAYLRCATVPRSLKNMFIEVSSPGRR